MGISPREFKNMSMNDVKDVMEIKNAWEQKSEREQKIAEAVNSIKH